MGKTFKDNREKYGKNNPSKKHKNKGWKKPIIDDIPDDKFPRIDDVPPMEDDFGPKIDDN